MPVDAVFKKSLACILISYSGFLTQSKDVYVRQIGISKLPANVNVINCDLSSV